MEACLVECMNFPVHVLEPLWGYLDVLSKQAVRSCSRSLRESTDLLITRLNIQSDNLSEAHGALRLWPNVNKISMQLRPSHMEAAISLLNVQDAWKWTELCIEALDALQQDQLLDLLPISTQQLRHLSVRGMHCSDSGIFRLPALKTLRRLSSLSIHLQTGTSNIVDIGSDYWQGNRLTHLCVEADSGITLSSGDCLEQLVSLTLIGPVLYKTGLSVDAWCHCTGLTKLHAPSSFRIETDTLPVLIGLPLLQDLSVLALDRIPQQLDKRYGAGIKLHCLRLFAYSDCCDPDALIDFLSWIKHHVADDNSMASFHSVANTAQIMKTDSLIIEHLKFHVTRSLAVQSSIRRLVDGCCMPLDISMVNSLDLDMASDAGLDNFGNASGTDEILLSYLCNIGERMEAVSLVGFHFSTDFAAMLARILPGLHRVILKECWLMPGSLNAMHSLLSLSYVKLTACLGSGVRPMFLLSFAANSPQPVHLHIDIGQHGGNEEEQVVLEMKEEVADLLRIFRPDSSFSWGWV